MKWYYWVILLLVIAIISMIAYFTPFFINLEWWGWVIIGLIAIIIGGVLFFIHMMVRTAKVFSELVTEAVVIPWLKGNFVKRE